MKTNIKSNFRSCQVNINWQLFVTAHEGRPQCAKCKVRRFFMADKHLFFDMDDTLIKCSGYFYDVEDIVADKF